MKVGVAAGDGVRGIRGGRGASDEGGRGISWCQEMASGEGGRGGVVEG